MMPSDARSLLALAGETLREPRPVFARLAAAAPGLREAVEVWAFVVVLGAMVTALEGLLLPPDPRMPLAPLLSSPLALAAAELGGGAVLALGAHAIGRRLGGQGSLAAMFFSLAWMQAVMVLIEVVEFLLLLIAPPLSLAVGFAAVVAWFWLFANAVAAVHGFPSALRVLLVTIGVMVLFLAGLGSFLGSLATP